MRTPGAHGSEVSSLNDPRPHYDFRVGQQPPTGRVVKVIALDRVSDADLADVAKADFVVMVTSAGQDARAAATVGEICSQRRITTATVVVRPPAASDNMLSRTLAQVRPWSLMVVVAGDESYLDDLLRSFR